MALKDSEKKVIDAFVDGKPEPRGNQTSYEIRDMVSLRGGREVEITELRGPMNSVLAHRHSDGIVIWAGTGGTQYQDSVYRYLKKTVPARLFHGYPGTNSQRLLHPNGRSDLSGLQGQRGDFYEDDPSAGFSARKDGRFFLPEYLVHGDYVGGSVGKANLKAWQEEFGSGEGDWWHLRREAYGTRMVVIDTEADVPEEAFEILSGLVNYPVISEEILGEVEAEDEAEAWESSFRRDFERAVEQEWGIEDFSDLEDKVIDALAFKVIDRAQIYWEHTDEGPYIDVGKIASGVTQKELEKLGWEFE